MEDIFTIIRTTAGPADSMMTEDTRVTRTINDMMTKDTPLQMETTPESQQHNRTKSHQYNRTENQQNRPYETSSQYPSTLNGSTKDPMRGATTRYPTYKRSNKRSNDRTNERPNGRPNNRNNKRSNEGKNDEKPNGRSNKRNRHDRYQHAMDSINCKMLPSSERGIKKKYSNISKLTNILTEYSMETMYQQLA